MLFPSFWPSSSADAPPNTLLDDYRVALLLALAASLTLAVLLIRLPLFDAAERVGWQRRVTPPSERLTLREVRRPPTGATLMEGAPITVFGASDASQREGNDARTQQPQAEAPPPAPAPPARKLKASQLVIENPDQVPRIEGGAGRLFMNIYYPEEARREGVEGRVVLEFVVDPKGHAKDVQVAETLHPLCDSSAVQAVRRTRFVPGRKDGEAVPVRLSLPIRFQLVFPPGEENAQTGSSATEASASL